MINDAVEPRNSNRERKGKTDKTALEDTKKKKKKNRHGKESDESRLDDGAGNENK